MSERSNHSTALSPRGRWKRWASRMLLALFAALVALLAALIVAVRRPLPPRSGRMQLPGLSAPVKVLFDARGIPHVRAATEEDAYRALGWLHAGDRLFQMEMRRRAAKGRLAEVLGEGLIPFDVESRRDGHTRLAERDLESASAGMVRLLEAYSHGVNAYTSSRPRPLELVALGIRPEPWTPMDTLAFARFMLADLSEARPREIQALRARGVPDPVEGGPFGETGGSNGWAISGTRTASGKPIFANDPHLGAELPGIWYAAHLTTGDGLDVAGLTLAGAPGVVIGHNGRIAWGLVFAQIDDADLYFELMDPSEHAVLRDGAAVSLTARTERISVRGGKDREVRQFFTDRGVVVGKEIDRGGGRAAATLMFAADRAPSSLPVFHDASRAVDAESLDRAWSRYGGPAFNVCFATADGHVGVRLAGGIPLRRASVTDEHGGAVEEWAGLVPDSDLPRIVDPPEGFVATANDDWGVTGRRLVYPGFYASDDRVRRIREMLSALREAAAADMGMIQNDVFSPYAARFIRRLSWILLEDPKAREAMTILEGWDGRVERTGPSRLFYEFLRELSARSRITGWAKAEEALGATPEFWDDPDTTDVERREEVIGEALAAALTRIRAEDGDDPRSWRWGRVHSLRYEHPFSSRVPLPPLREWLDPAPVELPGEVHTVNVQGFRMSREPRVRHIPSARLVVDLGDPDASTLVLPLGQSGQFQDHHYEDQVRAWATGRAYPFAFSRSAVDAAAASVLELHP